MWKVIGYAALYLTIAAGGAVVGWTVGIYRGRTLIGERSCEAMANSLYRAAQQARYEDIVTDKLGTSDIAESMRKTQYQEGAIRSWKIVRSQVTPIGVPAIVEVEVQRNKKVLEVLIIHSPFKFDNHIVGKKSIIGEGES